MSVNASFPELRARFLRLLCEVPPNNLRKVCHQEEEVILDHSLLVFLQDVSFLYPEAISCLEQECHTNLETNEAQKIISARAAFLPKTNERRSRSKCTSLYISGRGEVLFCFCQSMFLLFSCLSQTLLRIPRSCW